MDYLNVEIKANRSEFNWDDIECGNHNLNHSQNFFAQKHIKHESLGEMAGEDLINQMGKKASLHLQNPIKDESLGEMATEELTNQMSKEVSLHLKNPIKDESMGQMAAEALINQMASAVLDDILHEAEGVSEDKENIGKKPSKPPSNIACQWSTQKPLVSKYRAYSHPTGVIPKSTKVLTQYQTPHAYQFKDVYQRKKEEALRKRDEEERKRREFHSRPVPDYRAYHEQLQRRKVVHAVTCPVTPMVLKKSRETDEKRKKKLEEYKRKQQPPKFEQRPPTYLKEEPFVPKKTPTVVIQRPFKLMSEQRLQERKQFDEATQRTLEEKRKQEEIERKQREEEHIKELRKMTEFKARPNPFK